MICAISVVMSSLSLTISFSMVSSTLFNLRNRSWAKVDADAAASRFDLGSFGECTKSPTPVPSN